MALYDAEEIDQAAGALEKVLDVSSECAPVHFIPVHEFLKFVLFKKLFLLCIGMSRKLVS